MTVKSFLMIPNRKIPAVGKASYGRDLFLHLYCPHSRSKGYAARDEFMEWGGIALLVINNFTS